MKSLIVSAMSLIATLFQAFSQRDFAECERLIQKGAYPDGRDEFGNSLLVKAASSPKCLKLARMLLKSGAAVNGTNFLGETALLSAAWAGNVSAVKLLLKFGADPNVSSRSGYTPLMAATDSGNTEIVQKLLKEGADPHARKRHGVTALMRAAEEGHLDVVKVLVDAGADVNAADDNGDTGLMIAAAMDCKDVVGVLLAAGADRSLSTPYGWNALAFAAAFEHTEICEMLKTDLPEDEWPGPAVAVPALFEGAFVVQKEDAAHGFSQGAGAASVG